MSMQNDRLLRLTLRGNAVFSITGGIVAVAFAPSLAGLMTSAREVLPGMPVPTVLSILGLGLILFGGAVGVAASRPVLSTALGQAIFWADIAWILASCLLLLIAAPAFSAMGLAIVIVVALVVADFAAFEYWGLRRLRLG